jgi:hypothetical protein
MLKPSTFFLGLFLIFCLSTQIKAQDEEGADDLPLRPTSQIHLPFTIRFDGGLGFLNKPKAMRDNFFSIGDVGVGVYCGIRFKKIQSSNKLIRILVWPINILNKGVNLGLTGRYTAFQVSRNASNLNDPIIIDGQQYGTQPLTTTYTLWSPGALISYDRFVTPYSMLSFVANPSYAFVRYTNLRNISGDTTAIKKYSQYTPDTYNHRALTFQAAIAYHYFFEEHVAMTVKLGFTRTWSYFEPWKVRLDGGAISYESADLNGPVQFFTVGLGFVYSFKRID